MSREPRRVVTEIDQSALRRAVSIDAEVCELLSCFLPVEIVDISTSGCRVWAGFQLTPERPVRISIPGLAPIRATTVRAQDGYASFRFQTALHPSILGDLVARHPVPLRSRTG